MNTKLLKDYFENLQVSAAQLDVMVKADSTMPAAMRQQVMFLLGQIFASKSFDLEEEKK